MGLTAMRWGRVRERRVRGVKRVGTLVEISAVLPDVDRYRGVPGGGF